MPDAVMQAAFEIDAKHAYMEQQYKQKIVAVRPDSEKARSQVQQLLSELQLMRMPTQGKGGA